MDERWKAKEMQSGIWEREGIAGTLQRAMHQWQRQQQLCLCSVVQCAWMWSELLIGAAASPSTLPSDDVSVIASSSLSSCCFLLQPHRSLTHYVTQQTPFLTVSFIVTSAIASTLCRLTADNARCASFGVCLCLCLSVLFVLPLLFSSFRLSALLYTSYFSFVWCVFVWVNIFRWYKHTASTHTLTLTHFCSGSAACCICCCCRYRFNCICSRPSRACLRASTLQKQANKKELAVRQTWIFLAHT